MAVGEVSVVVLDTHAWVWWRTSPERLSHRQRAAIDRCLRTTSHGILVSIISLWEVALLAERGRLRFSLSPRAWLERAAEAPDTSVVGLSIPIVSTAVGLRGLRDPTDQLIVATAKESGGRLVTSDSVISSSGMIGAIV